MNKIISVFAGMSGGSRLLDAKKSDGHRGEILKKLPPSGGT